MNINLTIDQLILDGIDLPVHHRPHLQTAVEVELGRLLSEGGLGASLRGGGAVPGLSAPSVQIDSSGDPTEMGHQIAQAVYGGLAK
jgi:hypothetical protein